MKSILLALATLLVSSTLLAQHVAVPEEAGDSRPTAIVGLASSARHCVLGDAADVHGIGWVAAGTTVGVTFETDFVLAAAISSVDLEAGSATGVVGTPDIRVTASTPGTMALYVGATGQGGCYRYKVDVTPPAGSTAMPAGARATGRPATVKLSKSAGALAIAGLPSSAKHCIAGDYVSNVHDIGWVEAGNQITISFVSDFDPIAGVTLRNMGTQRGTYLVDDDAGGNLEPQLDFTASHSATLALYVGSFGGGAGCYRYKVEIR
jgi:hypothetical protein